MRLMRMGLAVYGALVRRSHVPHSVLAQGHQGWYVLGRIVDLLHQLVDMRGYAQLGHIRYQPDRKKLYLHQTEIC